MNSSSSVPPSLRRRQLAPWALFFGLLLIYQANGRFIAGSDVYCTRFMPVNLAKTGSYYFDPGKPYHLGTIVEDRNSPSFGKMISPYSEWPSTLLTPIYIPFYRWLRVPPEYYLTFYLDKFFAALFVAAGATITFLLIRRMHGGRQAMAAVATLAVALGSSMWAIASQGTWAHGPSIFFMALACWSLLRAIEGTRRWSGECWAALCGFAFASAAITRPTDILFGAPFGLLALWELRGSRRRAICLCAGAAAPVFWFLIKNMVMYGWPLTSGFQYNVAYQRIPGLISIHNFWEGFFGLLFSPALGLFTTFPAALFAVPGMAAIWMRPDAGTTAAPGAADIALLRIAGLGTVFIVAHTLFYACYREWWGGWTYAHRYLIDIMPFVAIAIGRYLRPGGRGFHFRWGLLVPALLFSAAFQFYGAFFWSGQAMFRLLKDTRPLHLDLGHARERESIFDSPSPFFSCDPADHLILSERQFFHWDWRHWPSFIKPFATPAKIHKDLFETKTVVFKPYPPIILDYGS